MNFPDIHYVINYGPPNTIEQFVQQTGRGGRDGRQALSVLYWHKRQLRTCDDVMLSYVHNAKLCRRQIILSEFGWRPYFIPTPLHKCCDVCSKDCSCSDIHLISLEKSMITELYSPTLADNQQLESIAISGRSRHCSEEDLALVRELLTDVRMNYSPSSTYTSYSITSGLTDFVLSEVLQKCSFLFTVDDLSLLIPSLGSTHLAKIILAVLEEVLKTRQTNFALEILQVRCLHQVIFWRQFVRLTTPKTAP